MALPATTIGVITAAEDIFVGDRIKSLIVDKGETLVNCLAYIDLNPVRAGLVDRPEVNRWNSLGYHRQGGGRNWGRTTVKVR